MQEANEDYKRAVARASTLSTYLLYTQRIIERIFAENLHLQISELLNLMLQDTDVLDEPA